jgi:ParE-like toxin of type II ParDE toxin-antitoxin system
MKSYNLIITEKAFEEYSDAFWFYENSRVGLGDEFEMEVENLIELICKNPFSFPRKYKRFREVPTRKFPFLIVYEIILETVVIHSVFHTKRNPDSKIS